jgi:membrane-associated HD superfamily phosphohydrolase
MFDISIIMMVLFIFLVISTYKDIKKSDSRNTDDNLAILSGLIIVVTIIFLIVSGTSYYDASMIYPNLLAKKAVATSLKSEISRIKNSYYPEKNNKIKSLLVHGSLDNMEQSKALSLYISKYAEAKSIFDSKLVKDQAICRMPIYWILGSNLVMNCGEILATKQL